MKYISMGMYLADFFFLRLVCVIVGVHGVHPIEVPISFVSLLFWLCAYNHESTYSLSVVPFFVDSEHLALCLATPPPPTPRPIDCISVLERVSIGQ